MTTKELRSYSFWLFLRMYWPKWFPGYTYVKRRMCASAYGFTDEHNFLFQAWK